MRPVAPKVGAFGWAAWRLSYTRPRLRGCGLAILSRESWQERQALLSGPFAMARKQSAKADAKAPRTRGRVRRALLYVLGGLVLAVGLVWYAVHHFDWAG